MSDVPYATPLGIANGSGFGSTWNNYDEYGRTRPAQGGASLGRRFIEAWQCCAQAGLTVRQVHRLVMRYRAEGPSGHMVGAGTSFHDNGTGMKRSEEGNELLAGALLAKHRFATGVLAVEVERVLPKVNADQYDVLHDGLLAQKVNTLQA